MVNRKHLTHILPVSILVLAILGQVIALPRSSASGPIASIQSPSGTQYPLAVTLHGAGATFPAPLIFDWAALYHTAYPNTTIYYNSIGSGGGQLATAQKVGDFGASDAPLSTAQLPEYPNILHIPETIGSVTFAYNLTAAGITQNLNFTGALVADIYLGSVHLWNDPAIVALNPGVASKLPNVNITTVRRSDNSGTTFVTTSYLASQSSTFATTIGASVNNCSATQTTNCVNWQGSATCNPLPCQLTGNGNPGVAQQIKTHQDSFGYVELNYALANGFTFGYLRNFDNTNYVLPSIQTTYNAVINYTSTHALPAGNGDWSGVLMINQKGLNTYPVSSFTYLLVYQELNVLPSMNLNETTQAQSLIKFLTWIITTGQTFSESQFYVPLPPSVVAVDQASINSITYTIISKPVHRTFSLSASSTTGWSLPSISVFSGDTVTLLLTSADGNPHQWFLDFNNNGVLDADENNTSTTGLILRVSPIFSSTTTPTNFTFIPLIDNPNSIPSYGTWTFRDSQSSAPGGSFSISPQQIAIPFTPTANNPTATTIPVFDTSRVTTQGSLILDLRTNNFSGSIVEITVDSASGKQTSAQTYTLTDVSLALHSFFLIRANVSPWPLSSNIFVSVNGLTGTATYTLTRELDMQSQGVVNIVDLSFIAIHFGSSVGQPGYIGSADVTAIGTVNIIALSSVAVHFNALSFT
jgi:phosphate transport system substrate-binding protein